MTTKWKLATAAAGLALTVIVIVVAKGVYTVGEGVLVAGFSVIAISIIAAFGIDLDGSGGGDGGGDGGWFGGDGGGCGCG